jgi:hypothetical protein
MGTDEGAIAHDLVDALVTGNPEMLQTALKRPQINFLDNVVCSVYFHCFQHKKYVMRCMRIRVNCNLHSHDGRASVSKK